MSNKVVVDKIRKDFEIHVYDNNDEFDINVANTECGWSENIDNGKPAYQLVLDIKKRELKQPINFNELLKKLPKENIERIRSLHQRASFAIMLLDALLDNTAIIPDGEKNKKEAVKQYALLIEELEFAMQAAWGIPLDSNYHTWWLKSKHCECPKMDNTDFLYFGNGKIITCECPVHGVK